MQGQAVGLHVGLHVSTLHLTISSQMTPWLTATDQHLPENVSLVASTPCTPAQTLAKTAAGSPNHPRTPAEEPRNSSRRHLEEKEGRLDPKYKTSGPKLSDAIDTTLKRPHTELENDWNLDDLALPGTVISQVSHTYQDCCMLRSC